MVKVICRKFSRLFTFSFSIFTFLLLSYSLSGGAQITGPEVKLQDHKIYVSTSLTLDDKYLQELQHGVTKEFGFYIDLFRIWNMWPDEFVLSKSFVRTLESDPVKMEHLATSNDGNTLIQKRFRSFKSMLQWALSINDLRLANMRELEPGAYFVRVTIESKIRKLPPVIGYFMIFLPENEFKIKKDSPLISVGTAR